MDENWKEKQENKQHCCNEIRGIKNCNYYSKQKNENNEGAVQLKRNAKYLPEFQRKHFNQQIYADEKIENYVTDIVDATRNPESYKIDATGLIDYGASPRASIWLILTAKANAMLNGRGYVIPEDIKAIAHEVLRHRILLSYEAEAENITTDIIIDKILSKIRSP